MERIKTKPEWINRIRVAMEELIVTYKYNKEDFSFVDPDDPPTLDYCAIYPKSWGEMVKYDEDGHIIVGWITDEAMSGIMVYWPQGTDCGGEAYDAQDPVMLLDHVQFWANLTDAEIKEMLK